MDVSLSKIRSPTLPPAKPSTCEAPPFRTTASWIRGRMKNRGRLHHRPPHGARLDCTDDQNTDTQLSPAFELAFCAVPQRNFFVQILCETKGNSGNRKHFLQDIAFVHVTPRFEPVRSLEPPFKLKHAGM